MRGACREKNDQISASLSCSTCSLPQALPYRPPEELIDTQIYDWIFTLYRNNMTPTALAKGLYLLTDNATLVAIAGPRQSGNATSTRHMFANNAYATPEQPLP